MGVNLTLRPHAVETAVPRELFAIQPGSFFEIAPDGQRFLVNVPDPTPRPLTVIVNWPSLLKPTAAR